MALFYDLVILDTASRPYRGDTTTGVGGSEHFVIKLARALGRRGLSVLVLNNGGLPTEEPWRADADGGRVTYQHHEVDAEIECKTLLLQRTTTLPGNVDFERLLVQVNDAAVPRAVNLVGAFLPRLGGTLVCCSTYQRAQYPAEWEAVVIPPILHEVERFSLPMHKDPHAFLYASAAVKGWRKTLGAWLAFRNLYPDKLKDARLYVMSSGYDEPGRVADPSVVYLGTLDDRALLTYLARVAGIFYVNVMPEMFPVPIALADALHTRTHVLCLEGVGGMREATTQTALVTTDPDELRTSFLEHYGDVGIARVTDLTRPPLPSAAQTIDRWMELVA